MGGNNRKDLKAYVRYDGSGRVVAGSLILRRKMPKVGKWVEISAYECCDPFTPTSTSSTTTTTTTTASSNYLVNLRQLFEDGTCSGMDLVSNYAIISANPLIVGKWYSGVDPMFGSVAAYIVSAGGDGFLLASYTNERDTCDTNTTTTTTTTTGGLTLYNADYTFDPVGDICNGTGQFNLPVLFPNGLCATGTVDLPPGYTWSLYGISVASTIRLKDPSSNNLITVNISSVSQGFSFGCNASC